jgi:hypothetical protein
MVDDANCSKEMLRALAATKARHEAEKKAKEEAAIRVHPPLNRVNTY